MTLVFGGLSFPLVAVGGRIPQPFTDAALPYLKDTINAYLGESFVETMKGKVNGADATLACQETGHSDPDLAAHKVAVRLPYLALWPENGTLSEGTNRWDNIETRYAFEYILPPLPFNTIMGVVGPFLHALVKLLAGLIKAGGDPAHDAGARVWEDAGIVSIRLGAWAIVANNLGNDSPTAQSFPMLTAEIFVVEQEGFAVEGPDLEEQDHTVDHSSTDGTYPALVETTFTPTLRRAAGRSRPRRSTMIVRLSPVEGAHAFSPAHSRIGLVTPIGYTRQPDSSLKFDGGIVTLTLEGDHANGDRAALRKDVLAGRINVADSASARVLDVPFAAEKKADTLPPPALEATPKGGKLWRHSASI